MIQMLCPNAMSPSHVTAECVAWSAIDMERKGGENEENTKVTCPALSI